MTYPRSIYTPVIGWLFLAAVVAAHQFSRGALGFHSFGLAAGVSVAWALLCAGGAGLGIRERIRERQLIESGMTEHDARARSTSWRRRAAVVSLIAAVPFLSTAYLVGLFQPPGFASDSLRGAGLCFLPCLMFATILAWIELRKGTPVGSGPHCARCGFPANSGLGGVCAECGQKFSFSFNLAEGGRSRPAWLKVAGAALPLAAGAAFLAVSGGAAPTLVGYLPTPRLIELAGAQRSPWSRAASDELAGRSLTHEQTEALTKARARSAPPPPTLVSPHPNR